MPLLSHCPTKLAAVLSALVTAPETLLKKFPTPLEKPWTMFEMNSVPLAKNCQIKLAAVDIALVIACDTVLRKLPIPLANPLTTFVM